MARAIINPLYHWTQLELATYFNEYRLLNENSALDIYERANKMLPRLNVHTLLKESKVEVVCTTDDPLDDLTFHALIREENKLATKVLPTFRPDQIIQIGRATFRDYIIALGEKEGVSIKTLTELLNVTEARLRYFKEHGAKISDHGLDTLRFSSASPEEVDVIFKKALRKEILTTEEIVKYESFLLASLGEMYAKHGLIQQYHIGALRNLNEKAFQGLGADTGFDAINDAPFARPLSELLSALELKKALPKTIIYTLNPRDFSSAVTVMQAF